MSDLFSELPDEITVQICNSISTEDLKSLKILSKKNNRICLEILNQRELKNYINKYWSEYDEIKEIIITLFKNAELNDEYYEILIPSLKNQKYEMRGEIEFPGDLKYKIIRGNAARAILKFADLIYETVKFGDGGYVNIFVDFVYHSYPGVDMTEMEYFDLSDTDIIQSLFMNNKNMILSLGKLEKIPEIEII